MSKKKSTTHILIAAIALIAVGAIYLGGGPTGRATESVSSTIPPDNWLGNGLQGMGASVYTLSMSDDAQGASSGYQYCKARGETCVQVEWAYKQDACPRTNGWCGFSEPGAEIRQFNCFSGGLIGPTYDGAEKRVYCAKNIGNIQGQQQSYIYWTINPDSTPYSTGDHVCGGSGSLKCVVVDWLYNQNCPNGGWCGPNTEGGTWKQFSCADASLDKPQFKGSLVRVLCKLG